MSRDPLAVLRNQAGNHATGAAARGDSDERRRWLDVLILLDQHEAAQPSTTRAEIRRAGTETEETANE